MGTRATCLNLPPPKFRFRIPPSRQPAGRQGRRGEERGGGGTEGAHDASLALLRQLGL